MRARPREEAPRGQRGRRKPGQRSLTWVKDPLLNGSTEENLQRPICAHAAGSGRHVRRRLPRRKGPGRTAPADCYRAVLKGRSPPPEPAPPGSRVLALKAPCP